MSDVSFPTRWLPRPRWGADAHVRAQAPGISLAVARVADVLSPHRTRPHTAPDERRAAARMPRWRAREYLAGRVLLRLLAAEAVPETGPDLAVARLPSGRPWLPQRPDVWVSISHSGPYVAAAVGRGHLVGVDVEVPRAPSPGMLRRCCGEGAERLAALPADRTAREFARLWTVKEACVKAHGTGLSGAPWRVPVEPGRSSGTWRELSWASVPWPGGGPAPGALGCAFGPPAAIAWTVSSSRTTAPEVERAL